MIVGSVLRTVAGLERIDELRAMIQQNSPFPSSGNDRKDVGRETGNAGKSREGGILESVLLVGVEDGRKRRFVGPSLLLYFSPPVQRENTTEVTTDIALSFLLRNGLSIDPNFHSRWQIREKSEDLAGALALGSARTT